MYIADTLSHAHLADISTCEFSRDLDGVDHTYLISVRKELLHKIMQRSIEDPVFMVFRETIINGWPERKIKVLECGNELVTQDQLVPKGHCLVISSAVRKEMMK